MFTDNWRKSWRIDGLSRHLHVVLFAIVAVFVFISLVYGGLFVRHQVVHGLHGFYYGNTSWQEPLWKSKVLDTDISSKAQNFQQAEQNLNNQFSIEWRGYIKISETGDYTFSTNSDDGSWLFIDDQLVVDNGGPHGLQKIQGTIHLTRGFHKIRIRYFQIGGYARLEVVWAKGTDSETPLQAEVLFPPDTFAARSWYPLVKSGLLLLLFCLGVAMLLGIIGWISRLEYPNFKLQSKVTLISIFILAVFLRSLVPFYFIRNNVENPFQYMLSVVSSGRWTLSTSLLKKIQPGFMLTKSSIQQLSKELPEEIVEALTTLKWKKFATKKEFLGAIEMQIGKEHTEKYHEQILKLFEVQFPNSGYVHVKHALVTAGLRMLLPFEVTMPQSVAWVQMMQGIFDSLGCLFIWGMLGLYFSRRIQVLGALIYALWLPSIFYAYHILAESYIPVLVLAFAYTSILSIRRLTWYFYALSGGLCALIVFFRSDNGLILPAYIFYIVWMYKQQLHRAIGKGAVIVLGFILVSWSLNTVTDYAIGGKVSAHHAGLGWGFYNTLAEYPGTYKELRFFWDNISHPYAIERAERYLQQNDAIFKVMYSLYNRDPGLLAYIREVIIGKPFLYADWLIRRFFAYVSALPYNACIAYFYTSPKDYHRTMLGYRYSQLYQGVKYVDYFLFSLFLVGVWHCRHNKAMLSVLWIYFGILIGHVFTVCGEVYFSHDLEYAYVQPKYLLGMVSVWPIFIPIGIQRVWNRMKVV